MKGLYDLVLHRVSLLIDDDSSGDSNVADSTPRHAEDDIRQEFVGQAAGDRTIGQIYGEEVCGLAGLQ